MQRAAASSEMKSFFFVVVVVARSLQVWQVWQISRNEEKLPSHCQLLLLLLLLQLINTCGDLRTA